MNQHTKNYLLSLIFIVVVASLLYVASTKMVKRTFDWTNRKSATQNLPSAKFSTMEQYVGDKAGCSVFETSPGRPVYEGVGMDLRDGVLCVSPISPNQDFVFYVNTDPKTGDPLGVEYSERGNESNSRYVELKTVDGKRGIAHPFDKDFIMFMDVNFDGYNDMLVTQDTGATGNVSYLAFLFDPKTSTFALNEDFSLMNIMPDPKTKTLRSFVTMGAAGMEYVSDLYRVENGKPILVEEVEQKRVNPEATSFIKVTRRLVKGVLQQVASETVTQ